MNLGCSKVPEREEDAQNTLPTEKLVGRLRASPFFQECQNSFRQATKLPLELAPAHCSEARPYQSSPFQNEFCRELNSTKDACAKCMESHSRLIEQSGMLAQTRTCLFGLLETSVPLKLGSQTIGFLRTGQVRVSDSSGEQLTSLQQTLQHLGFNENETKRLLEIYGESKVWDKNTYNSTITLLCIISLQISSVLGRIMCEESDDNEPQAVRQAKKYALDNLRRKISLDEVSHAVNLSPSRFCKLFKKHTGLTFIEYVNRHRVELAKKQLSNPDLTITNIAFATGFNSLSQFNRCFLKIAGEPPGSYRNNLLSPEHQKDFLKAQQPLSRLPN